MKRILFLAIALILLFSSSSDTTVAHAQLGGLLKKAKTTAEDTIKKKADEEVERQVEALVSNLWDEAADQFKDVLINALPKAKTTVDIKKGVVKREGLPDMKLRNNDDDPASGEFVSYLSISMMNLPDELDELTSMFGNATVSEVYLNGDLKLEGDTEQATLTNAETGVLTTIDHEPAQYWSISYAEMLELAGGMMDSVRVQMAAAQDEMKQNQAEMEQATSDPSTEMDVKVSVKKGDEKKIRGIKSRQHIVIVEMRPKESATSTAQETDGEAATNDPRGTFYLVTEIWATDKYAGSETLSDYNEKLRTQMMDAMSGSDTNLDQTLSPLGDPRMSEAMEQASEKLAEIEGFQVQTTNYFVVGPEDKDLDLDAVLKDKEEPDVRSFSGVSNEEPVEVQSTMFSTTSFISNLTTDSFEMERIAVPAGYTEVPSPLKQFMESGSVN